MSERTILQIQIAVQEAESGIARSVADAAQRMIHGRTPTIHWPTIH